MTSKNVKESAYDPHIPPSYNSKDVRAIQALYQGNANAEQQQHALKWIVEIAASTYDLAYRPGGEEGRRATDFALGRMFVGQQIVKLAKIKLSKLIEQEKKHGREPEYRIGTES